MKLLAIDTATEACSVALMQDKQVISQFDVCPQQHSQRLLPMVDEVLAEAGLTLKQLDALVFGRGPGSFTGVRIATGMIQGLALGTGLPVVGISTLAAMAQQLIETQNAQRVVAATDARMDEVYFGRFVNQNGLAVAEAEEVVCGPADAASQASDGFIPAGTGWAAYKPLTSLLNSYGVPLPEVLYPAARYMLSLAVPVVASGQAKDVLDIEPVYLRDKVTWKKLPGRE